MQASTRAPRILAIDDDAGTLVSIEQALPAPATSDELTAPGQLTDMWPDAHTAASAPPA